MLGEIYGHMYNISFSVCRHFYNYFMVGACVLLLLVNCILNCTIIFLYVKCFPTRHFIDV
jgi:hypothetical protein